MIHIDTLKMWSGKFRVWFHFSLEKDWVHLGWLNSKTNKEISNPIGYEAKTLRVIFFGVGISASLVPEVLRSHDDY